MGGLRALVEAHSELDAMEGRERLAAIRIGVWGSADDVRRIVTGEELSGPDDAEAAAAALGLGGAEP